MKAKECLNKIEKYNCKEKRSEYDWKITIEKMKPYSNFNRFDWILHWVTFPPEQHLALMSTHFVPNPKITTQPNLSGIRNRYFN